MLCSTRNFVKCFCLDNIQILTHLMPSWKSLSQTESPPCQFRSAMLIWHDEHQKCLNVTQWNQASILYNEQDVHWLWKFQSMETFLHTRYFWLICGGFLSFWSNICLSLRHDDDGHWLKLELKSDSWNKRPILNGRYLSMPCKCSLTQPTLVPTTKCLPL